MSKHTPGLWHIRKELDGYYSGSNTRIFSDADGFIAKTTKQDGRLNPHDKEAEANAHLIASAPELLEACRRIDKAPYGVALGDLEFLRQAIAKAEGAENKP